MSHGGRGGGVREIKGLADGVKEVFMIWFVASLLGQGNGRNPASASCAMAQDSNGNCRPAS